jgi:hypothetical protein
MASKKTREPITPENRPATLHTGPRACGVRLAFEPAPRLRSQPYRGCAGFQNGFVSRKFVEYKERNGFVVTIFHDRSLYTRSPNRTLAVRPEVVSKLPFGLVDATLAGMLRLSIKHPVFCSPF